MRGGRGSKRGLGGGGPIGMVVERSPHCDTAPPSPQESGDDEYRGDQSDSDDEVDSDFDIDEGEEPTSDQDESEPKRRRRVVTKAYRVRGQRGTGLGSPPVPSEPLGGSVGVPQRMG